MRPATGDGDGLVSHAGMAWLAGTADAPGPAAGLTAAMASVPDRRQDPGRTLAQIPLPVADVTTCLSDVAARRAQPAMLGAVASDATVWRTFDQVGSVEMRAACAAARKRPSAACARPAGKGLVIDLDATLINTKSDKHGARPSYKRGYGYRPLWATIAEIDEVLAGMQRLGNTGSNTAIDHVVHRVLTRADAGGASHWFADGCVDPNVEFSFGFHIGHRVRDGVRCVRTGCW